MLALLHAAAPPQDDTRYYSVSYIEVNPSSRSAALTTLRQHRDMLSKYFDPIRTEIFEQANRSGHFVIVETWKTQGAFDAVPAARQPLSAAIQPVRISDWDTRPYKTLSVGPDPAEAGDNAVVVITHVDVSPDPSVGPMLRALADASRREAGNLRFDVLQHTMRANHFQVFETWQNQKALDAHATAAHTRKYRDDVQRFLGSPLDERIFKAIR
jgi:quinol monooxygenase YgiN